MIKKIYECDRCKKEIKGSYYYINIINKNSKPLTDEEFIDQTMNRLFPEKDNGRIYCQNCVNEIKEFIKNKNFISGQTKIYDFTKEKEGDKN